MSGPSFLTDLEQLLLLAVLRLGEDAYGAAIQAEIRTRTRRRVSLGTLYVTFARLEERGMAKSRMGPPQPVRGGKSRRIYSVTARGRTALERSREAVELMWDGLAARENP